MSTQELIILGILYETERYGYEIDKILDLRQIRPWNRISLSSIYAVLGKLRGKGYVDYREVSQGGRPPRKIYGITESGRIAFNEVLDDSILSTGQLLGRFEIILLVWSIISSAKKKTIIRSYFSRLKQQNEFYREGAAAEYTPDSAAMFERPLYAVQAEIEWLTKFALKNEIPIDDL